MLMSYTLSMTKKPNVAVTFTLPYDQLVDLDEAVYERGVTRSQWIREAISAYLNVESTTPEQARRPSVDEYPWTPKEELDKQMLSLVHNPSDEEEAVDPLVAKLEADAEQTRREEAESVNRWASGEKIGPPTED